MSTPQNNQDFKMRNHPSYMNSHQAKVMTGTIAALLCWSFVYKHTNHLFKIPKCVDSIDKTCPVIIGEFSHWEEPHEPSRAGLEVSVIKRSI